MDILGLGRAEGGNDPLETGCNAHELHISELCRFGEVD